MNLFLWFMLGLNIIFAVATIFMSFQYRKAATRLNALLVEIQTAEIKRVMSKMGALKPNQVTNINEKGKS